MIKRDHLLSFLKINGLSLDSSDQDIIAALAAARYSSEETTEMLGLLRQNITPNQTRTDGLHKVFFSDIHLEPGEVSRLLGVDIVVSDQIKVMKKRSHINPGELVIIGVVSALLAFTGLLSYMYLHEIGLFYPPLHVPWE